MRSFFSVLAPSDAEHVCFSDLLLGREQKVRVGDGVFRDGPRRCEGRHEERDHGPRPLHIYSGGEKRASMLGTIAELISRRWKKSRAKKW